MKRKPALYLILILVSSLALLSACSGPGTEEPPQPEPTPPAAETAQPEETSPLDEVVGTRAPAPTATPGLIAEQVTEFTTAVGLASETFLGLAAEDWINLALSLLFILIGYGVGTWLIRTLLRRVARRTPTDFDEMILKAIAPQLRWLVVILALYIATVRLTFVGPDLKTFLIDVYFALGLLISIIIVWRLIDLAHEWYRQRLTEAKRIDELDPVLLLLTRVSRILLVVVGLSIILSHFGINVVALTAAMGIAGLAFSLAAQDTLSDAISGFIILADRPFRVGDRIEIESVGTWGDVVDIGLRTTRIRTRDNRMVIVPNSMIGKNQVINYTYPDPHYRIQTHVGIAYGTDIETARQLIIETVRGVEGVLADRPVDALYNEMGDSTMIFRVRWWIESYADTRRVIDKVNTALQEALDAAGIETPFNTLNVNLTSEPPPAE
jgi:small-conductance mechanosensitive channel